MHVKGHEMLKIRVPREGRKGRIACSWGSRAVDVAAAAVGIPVVVEASVVVEKEVEVVAAVEKVQEKVEVVVVEEIEKEKDSVVTIAPILSESVVILTPLTPASIKKPLDATFLSDVRPPPLFSSPH